MAFRNLNKCPIRVRMVSLLSAFLLLVSLLLVSCSSNEERQHQKDTASESGRNHSVDSVDASSAHVAETNGAQPFLITRIIHLTGNGSSTVREFSSSTKGIREARIDAKRPGRIVAVDVGLGEYVKAGQTLIRLDSSLERLAVDAAYARRESTEATKTQAERDLRRAQELFEGTSISQSQLEKVKLKLQVASSAYDGAVADLGIARRNLDETRIIAPFSGEVTSLPYEVGETPIPGSSVVEITDRSQLIAEIFLAEDDLPAVKAGMHPEILVAGDPLERSAGVLRAISPKGNERTNLFKGEVLIDNDDLRLRAGVACRVMFPPEENEHPVVPYSAIIASNRTDSPPELVVISSTEESDTKRSLTATVRHVTLGERAGSGVTVLTGLDYGERVVVSGAEKLKDGQVLRAIKEVPLDSLLD